MAAIVSFIRKSLVSRKLINYPRRCLLYRFGNLKKRFKRGRSVIFTCYHAIDVVNLCRNYFVHYIYNYHISALYPVDFASNSLYRVSLAPASIARRNVSPA